jgi:hypothetical protein
MREAFTEAWQGATHVSGLPQQAAVLPSDSKLQCTDVKVLMRGGEYDVVLMDTPHELFCQFARPVTCIIATQKQLLAMSLAHNAAVALVKPQKVQWLHESWREGVSLTDPYDEYGDIKYDGDNHGFFNMSMTDIRDMTDAKGVCSKTSPAILEPLGCFTGKTVGSNPEGGPVMGSVSGLTARVTDKKTKQSFITSAEGPPLLEPGHGLVVMVSLQAEMKVFGGDNSECEICFEPNPICLTSCGHAKVCQSCVERIGHGTDKKVCPMCREPIYWAVEVQPDTQPEEEQRPSKTAKLSPEKPVPASNGAAAGPSDYETRPEIDESDDELKELMFGQPDQAPTPKKLRIVQQRKLTKLYEDILSDPKCPVLRPNFSREEFDKWDTSFLLDVLSSSSRQVVIDMFL